MHGLCWELTVLLPEQFCCFFINRKRYHCGVQILYSDPAKRLISFFLFRKIKWNGADPEPRWLRESCQIINANQLMVWVKKSFLKKIGCIKNVR